MVALEAEYLLPGHGLPVVGADRVATALTDTAELLESLVSQTLAVMNGGGRLDEAIHSVVIPRRLVDRPYLQPVYDEPEFIVRTIWRLYGGWWDGNPATLKPPPERALAAEVARLAGGAAALAARAVELAESVDAEAGRAEIGLAAVGPGGLGPATGDLRVASLPGGEDGLRTAGHLAELAWLAAPGDAEVSQARHRVFSIRADRATSTMATGVYRWAASESLGDPSGRADRSGGHMTTTEGIDPSVPPSGTGCVECDASDGWWLHLRRCAGCGHIGCCDTSPSQHATAHAKSSGHPSLPASSRARTGSLITGLTRSTKAARLWHRPITIPSTSQYLGRAVGCRATGSRTCTGGGTGEACG